MMGPSLHVGCTEPLTRREAEVLLWIAEGKTAWEIGRILGVSESTATAHAKAAMSKLGAGTRPHLVTRGFIVGILRIGGTLLLVVALVFASAGEVVKQRPTARRRRRDDEPSEVAHFCAHSLGLHHGPAGV